MLCMSSTSFFYDYHFMDVEVFFGPGVADLCVTSRLLVINISTEAFSWWDPSCWGSRRGWMCPSCRGREWRSMPENHKMVRLPQTFSWTVGGSRFQNYKDSQPRPRFQTSSKLKKNLICLSKMLFFRVWNLFKAAITKNKTFNFNHIYSDFSMIIKE